METIKTINELLDRAKSHTGSDAATARAIGAAPQTLSNWRHGSKPCPIEDQALIADVAGVDAISTIARGMVEKHAGTDKGRRLAAVLQKSSLAIGAALASSGAIGAVSQGFSYLTRCIERLSRRRRVHS